jgi:hypothetical protein
MSSILLNIFQDSRPCDLQGGSATISFSSRFSKIEKEYKNYFTTYPAELDLLYQAQELIEKGAKFLGVLYTYRSVAQSIPEISLSDYATEDLTVEEKAALANKTNEINQKLIEILRPEMAKIVSLISYITQATNLFHNMVLHATKKKDGNIPEIFKLTIVELLDVLMKVSLQTI